MMVPAEPVPVLQAVGLMSALPIRFGFCDWVRKPTPAVTVVLSTPWTPSSLPGSGMLKSPARAVARIAALAVTMTPATSPLNPIAAAPPAVLCPDRTAVRPLRRGGPPAQGCIVPHRNRVSRAAATGCAAWRQPGLLRTVPAVSGPENEAGPRRERVLGGARQEA